ncbi:MAG: oxidoreductase [Clostridiales Family XIII bacterium]|jgi:Fe-S-cluster-containing dehydrogenase component|nr:oxidoreductase [Clostridiales Family XIII bacterium]
MDKIHMIVDLAKCVGCYNCLMACKDEFVDNCWLPYTDKQQKHAQKWIVTDRVERGKAPHTDLCFVTKLCRHCDDPACEKAAPLAVQKREDGIVLLDPEESSGDSGKALTDACPYGNISWNSELETAQKCTMCAHLLDNGWAEPRCVQACPLRALSIVKCSDADFSKVAEDQSLEPLSEGPGTPRVLYKNLHRYKSNFISGELYYTAEDGTERAASGAKVSLALNDTPLAETLTDFFGEFRFDYIPDDSGKFDIECRLSGYETITLNATIKNESVCLDAAEFIRE